MAAATTKSRKAKPQSKAKGTSQRQIEANRRNAKKSTGPRTADGKRSSKFNAVTHGMTAKSAWLPGEDAGALAARRREMLDDLQPRNRLEATLILRIADDAWIADRCQEAAMAHVSFRVRHEPLEQAGSEKDQALALGEHLLWKPAWPLPNTSFTHSRELTEPPAADVAVHPRHPARVLLRLEQTTAGCDWLLARWGDLAQRLNVDRVWRPLFAFQMVRLTGHRAIDMEENFDVTRMLLCSLTLLLTAPKAGDDQKPFNWATALTKMMTYFELEGPASTMPQVIDVCNSFTSRMAALPLARMAPEDDKQARQWLTAVIEREVERIRQIRAVLQKVADADAAEAPARLAIESGPEGENDRRYLLSSKRVLNQSISKFLTTRNMSERGAFDYLDLDSIDPFDPDLPHDSQDRPAATSPGQTGDCQPGAVEVKGGVSDENEAPDTLSRVTLSDVDAKTCDLSTDKQSGCGDDQNLRNEAISLVSGPSSVVRPEVESSDEPSAPSASPPENATNGSALANDGEHGQNAGLSAGTNDADEALETEIERERVSKLLWDGVARLGPIRAEDLRKLNEDCRKDEQDAKAAARRSRRHANKNGQRASDKVESDKSPTTVAEVRDFGLPTTPTNVAAVCDADVLGTTGLAETGYNNAGAIAAQAEEPACYPKADDLKICPESQKPLVASPSLNGGCDDNPILRNEPIEVVHGPLSVVRFGAITTDESDATGAADHENATNEPPRTPVRELEDHDVKEATDDGQRTTDKEETLTNRARAERIRAERFALWRQQKLKSMREADRMPERPPL